jgi:hypothetical protein
MCIWVAAYLKQAGPDLPAEKGKGATSVPASIFSTPLLGELSVFPQALQPADQKGVKRSADKTPKDASASSSLPTLKWTLKQADHKILKRTVLVTGPALLPHDNWDKNEDATRLLRKFAKEQADETDARDFSKENIFNYFDIQRPLKIGVSIFRVPQKPAHLIPDEALGNLDEMYGRGDTADFKRLMQVFNSPAATILLRPSKDHLLFQDSLVEAVYRSFVRKMKEGPPNEPHSKRANRQRQEGWLEEDRARNAPPEPNRPPTWTSSSWSNSNWEWQPGSWHSGWSSSSSSWWASR